MSADPSRASGLIAAGRLGRPCLAQSFGAEVLPAPAAFDAAGDEVWPGTECVPGVAGRPERHDRSVVPVARRRGQPIAARAARRLGYCRINTTTPSRIVTTVAPA